MKALLAALSAALLSVLAVGCGGGQYGYAHAYEPLGEERAYMDRSVELSYEEVRRTRFEQQQLIGWFGVVTAPPVQQGEQTQVVLSLRAHQERHLCSSSSSDSCRVTVSDREIGRFTAHLRMRPEDRDGQRRLWTGSLLKIYGTATDGQDENGGPIVEVDWYRHWPVHHYVTTGAAGSMRQ